MRNLLSFFLCLVLVIITVGCGTTTPTAGVPSSQADDVSSPLVSSESEPESSVVESLPSEEPVVSEKSKPSQPEASVQDKESEEPPQSVAESVVSIPSSPVVSEEPPKPLPTCAQVIWNLESDYFQGFWDGWLYYRGSDSNTGKRLYYRTLPDNTQKQTLEESPHFFGALATQDDWVYYSDQPVSVISCPTRYFYTGAISRIRTDGTQQARYPETVGVENVVLFDDWIYYYGNNAISRIRTDGTEHQKLIDITHCHSYTVGKQGIFFEVIGSNHPYQDQIIRCDLDGSNPTTLLYEPECSNLDVFFIEQDYLYIGKYYGEAVNGFQGRELGRMRMDGTGYQTISRQDGFDDSIEIRDGWIYYIKYTKETDENARYSLSRVRSDGSEFQTLYTHKKFESWEIVNDQIYFLIQGEDRDDVVLHRIALDGTNHTVLYQQTKEDRIRYHGYFIEDDIPYVVLTDREAAHSIS